MPYKTIEHWKESPPRVVSGLTSEALSRNDAKEPRLVGNVYSKVGAASAKREYTESEVLGSGDPSSLHLSHTSDACAVRKQAREMTGGVIEHRLPWSNICGLMAWV